MAHYHISLKRIKRTKIHRLKKYRDILGGELWVFFPKFSETAQA